MLLFYKFFWENVLLEVLICLFLIITIQCEDIPKAKIDTIRQARSITDLFYFPSSKESEVFSFHNPKLSFPFQLTPIPFLKAL